MWQRHTPAAIVAEAIGTPETRLIESYRGQRKDCPFEVRDRFVLDDLLVMARRKKTLPILAALTSPSAAHAGPPVYVKPEGSR